MEMGLLGIDEILSAWTEFAIRKLRENLRKKRMVFSADLEASLKFQISQANAQGLSTALLTMRDHGRFRDMRQLKYTRPAPGNPILDWVQKIGISKFRYIPGYNPAERRVRRVPVASIAMNRIAWGIAWGRFTQGKVRRKQWLNKYFYGPLVGELIDQVVAATGKNSVSIVEDAFNAPLS
jgi:hypothetical protein